MNGLGHEILHRVETVGQEVAIPGAVLFGVNPGQEHFPEVLPIWRQAGEDGVQGESSVGRDDNYALQVSQFLGLEGKNIDIRKYPAQGFYDRGKQG